MEIGVVMEQIGKDLKLSAPGQFDKLKAAFPP